MNKKLLFQSLRFQAKAFTHTCKNNTNLFLKWAEVGRVCARRFFGCVWYSPMRTFDVPRFYIRNDIYVFLAAYVPDQLQKTQMIFECWSIRW